METASASSSVVFSFVPLSSLNNYNRCLYDSSLRNSNLNYSNFHLGPRHYSFPRTFLPSTRFTAFCTPSGSLNQDPSPELAVLLEVDGVLMDAYRLGNRHAFNIGGVTYACAFQKLGLDCANWTEHIYLDLVRKSARDEERMLALYFNRIGWPTSLPTTEKESFIKSVLREKKMALDEFVSSKDSPLRPGAQDFIDNALKEGIPVVILTSCGKSEEKISRSVVDKLGHDIISKAKIVGTEEVEKSLYGQLALGQGILSGLDEQLAKEARKAASAEKLRIAEEVATLLKLSVDVDTSSSESLEKIVAALRAGAEYAGVPVNRCVLIAGSKSGVAAAERIGMPCVFVRSSLTSRAEFPSATAVMDGFGGADLTISRLRQKFEENSGGNNEIGKGAELQTLRWVDHLFLAPTGRELVHILEEDFDAFKD